MIKWDHKNVKCSRLSTSPISYGLILFLQQALQNAISKHRRCKITTKDLYPPGQVVHIVEEEPAMWVAKLVKMCRNATQKLLK